MVAFFPLPLYGSFTYFQTIKNVPTMQFEAQVESEELDVVTEVETLENTVAQLEEDETNDEEEMEDEEVEDEMEEESDEEEMADEDATEETEA